MAIWVNNHLLTGMVLQVSSYGRGILGNENRKSLMIQTAPKYVVKMFLFLKTLLPSRKLTYPAKREKENHRLKSALGWDMLVPRRVYIVWVVVSFFLIFTTIWGRFPF